MTNVSLGNTLESRTQFEAATARSMTSYLEGSRSVGRNDVDEAAAEPHGAVDARHEGVVLASLDEIAGLELGCRTGGR